MLPCVAKCGALAFKRMPSSAACSTSNCLPHHLCSTCNCRNTPLCCSVLQYAAVCAAVCVAVCVAVRCSVWYSVCCKVSCNVCCSVCCSVLHFQIETSQTSSNPQRKKVESCLYSVHDSSTTRDFGMILSTENATPPQFTKSIISNSLVQFTLNQNLNLNIYREIPILI